MKRKFILFLIFLLLCCGMTAESGEKPKIPHAGSDVTPQEAHKMLQEDPEHTFLIYCRSMAEYEIGGHPPMAYNIPYKFWTPYGMRKNEKFIKDVAEKFKKTDRLILLCKGGKWSAYACNDLASAGFTHVYNVLGGFEGEMIQDKNDPRYSHRGLINGWKHDGLPYTFVLEEPYKYKKHTGCGCD